MFEILIKNSDGSIYWQMPVNSQDEADEWISEEKTRPYWKDTFQVEIIDKRPPPPTPEEVAAKESEKADEEKVRKALKGIKKSDLVDVPACADAILKIIKRLHADR